MELRHLRYFIAAAEEENVSRAALKLHVSQPGLSRQIRDLEAELGFLLLKRSAKSVRLTEAGRMFLTEARAVLQRLDEGVKAARAVATSGRVDLHVGYAPSPTARILPSAWRTCQAEFPNVRVRLHDLSTEGMLAGLRDGKLHLALMVKPAAALLRGLHFTALTTDTLRFAVAPRHPLARKRAVTVAEIAREPLVVYRRDDYPDYHTMVEALFAGAKVKPRIAAEHDGVTSLIAAVESGAGVALVSESVACLAGPRVKLIPITPTVEPAIIGAATFRMGLNAMAEHFLKAAKLAASEK